MAEGVNLHKTDYIISKERNTDMKNPITPADLAKYTAYHEADAVRQAMTSVFAKTGMNDMAFVTKKAKTMQFFFNHDIKTMGATNQQGS